MLLYLASTEIPWPDKCARPANGSATSATFEDQPSREALCLLTNRPLSLDELHSVMYTLLGFILLLAVSWFWWRNDDEYFLYGPKARRCTRRISEWHNIRGQVVGLLQSQRDQSISDIEDSHIDLVKNQEDAVRNCNDHSAKTNKLLQEIKEACEDSIHSYRTANIEIRPRLVVYPSHWNTRWTPSWIHLPSDPLDDLCSKEKAAKLAKHEDQIRGSRISAIEEDCHTFLQQVFTFGPQME